MSIGKHTPGPWKVVSATACAEIEVMEIADVSHLRVIPAAGGWPTPGTPEDDARLIAAAPELLEALKEIISAADGDGWNQLDASFATARAAIAKATGGHL